MKGRLKKNIHAWAMYDWANSAYNLVVTTTFFPIYFIEATYAHFGSHTVSIGAWRVANNALYDYTLAFAYFLIMLGMPLLSAFSDKYVGRLFFLKLFSFLGGISCIGLFFFTGANISWGLIFFLLSTIGYSGGLIFYNAFLPHIAPKYLHNSISAKGFTYGYVGSVILQIIGLFLVIVEPFGIPDAATGVRISFVLVGLWWIGFAAYSLHFLKKTTQRPAARRPTFTHAYKALVSAFRILLRNKKTTRFLWAYMFYNMGVETIMLVAIHFGKKDLNIASERLIITAILLQLIAAAGIAGVRRLLRYAGELKLLWLMCCLWLFICIGGYFIRTEAGFYILALFVGLIMGATQSLSRSAYSKQIEYKQRSASFFTFYDILRTMGIVLGLFSFALIEDLSGDTHKAILFLGLLFAISVLIFCYYFATLKKGAARRCGFSCLRRDA